MGDGDLVRSAVGAEERGQGSKCGRRGSRRAVRVASRGFCVTAEAVTYKATSKILQIPRCAPFVPQGRRDDMRGGRCTAACVWLQRCVARVCGALTKRSAEAPPNKLCEQGLNAVGQLLHAVTFADYCVGGEAARECFGDRVGIHGE